MFSVFVVVGTFFSFILFYGMMVGKILTPVEYTPDQPEAWKENL